MKIRVFKQVIDNVFRVRICTEDWSEHDKELMVKFGEPEINLGGTFSWESPASADSADSADSSDSSGSSSSSDSPEPIALTIDDAYVRVMTESPFTYKFDARDLSGIDNARSIASLWALAIEDRLAEKIRELRAKDSFFTTEEITEY